MQKHVNPVDLVKSFPTNIFLQNLASIQKRTSPVKFAHLAEKSGKGSVSNLSTKLRAGGVSAQNPEHHRPLEPRCSRLCCEPAPRAPETGSAGSFAGRASVGKISAKCCSFSAVSAPIFATKYAFCSIFQNLPDFQAEIFEIWQYFANFATFAKFLLNFHENCCFFKPIFCENFEIAAVQKDANLVELEKCCQTHIFLQNFVLIQPRTSPLKICKFCKFLQNLPILLTLTPTKHRSEHVRRADERRELLPEAAAAAEVRS